MNRYNPKSFESKWQDEWNKSGIYKAKDNTSKPKKYILEYFPYPSGAAMHVGHVRNYSIGDAIARFSRMQGFEVLHPMGWDAFGLPAENYAIKNKISPAQAISQNTTRFKSQLNQMGFSYDWSREINSTDPKYYRWTQWFFLLLYKKGLAYQQESLQWWCPVDKTVLANEQVEAGLCWRCGNKVEKKSLKQWFFKITDYADRLLEDLDDINWPEAIKSMQRNWIGKSKGALIDFKVDDSDKTIQVFTTRPDTIYGATFLVLAPEHELVSSITSKSQKNSVGKYIKDSQAKSDIERQETNREKTGVFSDSYAINPLTGEKIPIWLADYVLVGYGTGAIMAVPAHDERDFEFAKKFNLEIRQVISNNDEVDGVTLGEGSMISSGEFTGLNSADAREKIVEKISAMGIGSEKVNYKMRDWLISRQRYWGAPIPIIYCPKDGVVPVDEDQLPVLLPEIESIEPSGDGRSPLVNVPSFVKTTCPKCGGPAERETDTMDGFACSSWYFLRFADPDNQTVPFDKSKADYWLPVDEYIGGAEHAVMHLLYARFWTKVMYDDGLINFTEPFTTLRNQGMILAPDGSKMSKSKNNTIEPDSLIESGYGADSIRIMELFIGPWNQASNWSVDGLGGSYRFLQRVWKVVGQYIESSKGNLSQEINFNIKKIEHKTIKKVTKDLENLNFNTAVSALMEYVNELYKIKELAGIYKDTAWDQATISLLKLLCPIAPHITEELWHLMGQTESIHLTTWPTFNESIIIDEVFELVVQINGKVRAQLSVATSLGQEELVKLALKADKIIKYTKDKTIVKTIVVPGKLINFVI